MGSVSTIVATTDKTASVAVSFVTVSISIVGGAGRMKGEVGLANLLLCMVRTCAVTTPSGVYGRSVVEVSL